MNIKKFFSSRKYDFTDEFYQTSKKQVIQTYANSSTKQKNEEKHPNL